MHLAVSIMIAADEFVQLLKSLVESSTTTFRWQMKSLVESSTTTFRWQITLVISQKNTFQISPGSC
jgi:hypothetical protein